MKRNYLFFLAACLVLLGGCAKPIMPAIEYNKPIDLQVNRHAALYWEEGKQSSSTVAATNNNSLVGSIAESIDRQNNPSRYQLSYGKAEQAIFITSFRNILNKQQVFKEVELVTDPSTANPKDVLVTLYFRSTRVSSPERGYQISLSVDMTVKALGKPTFMRTYFVKSDDNCGGSFQEQQNKVSIKLVENLIAGLKQWHQQGK